MKEDINTKQNDCDDDESDFNKVVIFKIAHKMPEYITEQTFNKKNKKVKQSSVQCFRCEALSDERQRTKGIYDYTNTDMLKILYNNLI